MLTSREWGQDLTYILSSGSPGGEAGVFPEHRPAPHCLQSYPHPTSCPGEIFLLVFAPSRILHPHCPCCPATPSATAWVHRGQCAQLGSEDEE